MKKAIIITAAALTALLLCVGLTGCLSIHIGNGNGVTGNGQVTTKEITLEKAVTGAKTMTSIDIVLDPTLEGKAVLEGESNILEQVKVDQESAGVVAVDYLPNTMIFTTRPVTLRVPLIMGGTLTATSSGSISIAGDSVLKGERFYLNTSSSGSITVRLETDKLTVISSSSGSINVTGSAKEAQITLSSSGSFDGADCSIADANVKLSSSGSAQLNVTNSLTGSLSSSGNVVYSGNPVKVQVSESSSGRAISR